MNATFPHGGGLICTTKRCVVPVIVVLLIMLILLAGCASPPGTPGTAVGGYSTLEAPRNVRDWIATGYALNASARRAAAGALKAGQIDKGDAERILQDTDATRAALDEARSIQARDPATALAKAQYAAGVLNAGLAFLTARGVK